MSSDLDVIRELGREIGSELEEVEHERIKEWGVTGYSTDGNDYVVGLSLFGSELKIIPSQVFFLKNLQRLNLSYNRLSELPAEILQLQNLTELNLNNNQLSELPAEILQLQNLTTLYLGYNQLSELPAEILQLRNLTELDLSGNQLSKLPAEILQLQNLTELNLGYNQLSELPAEIGQLQNLTELNLVNNKLSKLPAEILQLQNLTELNLGYNQLSKLPAEILQLQNLTELNLGYNQLSKLPAEIVQLQNLTELDLSENQLSKLPAEIGQLRNLTELDLSGNQLSELPAEIGQLRNLTTLYLSGNQLSELPAEIGQLRNLTTLYLSGNPLTEPPIEIAEEGIASIKEYFKSLEGEKRALNEVKVLLVGDGGAGKTSLVKQLFKETFDPHELQTHGIKIRDWDIKAGVKDIHVHFWDFGGQDIMHATHQFFLSKRSLYVLVLDGRKEEKTDYWLKHIRSFGGDSPVLVVLNKLDENPSFDVNRKWLQEKYPFIKGFYPVSCKTGKGIKYFIRYLKVGLAQVKLIGNMWANSWFEVKSSLEKMDTDFISCKQYVELCVEQGITEESARDTLMSFLHDLGVIIHFEDLALLDTYVIDPRWITGAVYKIINSEKLAETKGILNLKLLGEILERKCDEDYYYPPERYRFIIDLMKKFELCYELDNNRILIPDLLEVQEPEFDFDYDNSLGFVIEYDFLPKSILPRFIVRMHNDIKGDLRWRTGVVLEDEEFDSTAVIIADEEAKKICINVTGTERRDYFAVMLFQFRDINKSFEKLEAIEKVPMPDNPKITVSYEHLLRLEKKGIEMYLPDGSDKECNVNDLLGIIYVEKKGEKELIQLLRRIKTESDTEETLLKKASDALIVQPTIFGIGFDGKKIKDIVSNLFKKDKKKTN